jgi:PmbA protein
MTSSSRPDLLEIARRIASQAAAGEQVEAYAARSQETSVRAFDGDVESLSQADDEGVGIRVIVDHRQGFAWAGSLDPEVIADTLQEARDNASFATPDEFLDLADPDGVPAADLDLWSDELAGYPTDKKVELALELERRVRAGDPRIRQVPHAGYGDGSVEAAVASSKGIEATYRRTGCSISAYALAGQGDETMTGSGYSVGRGPGDLDLERATADAVLRATRLLGARKPPSARVTVVLDPEIASDVLGILAGTLNGEAVLKGRSLFADRVGESVSVPGLTLVDDPTNPNAYAAAAYDAEGLACRRNVLIDDGVLQGYLYDTYAGRRAGRPSTGSAVRGGFKSGPGPGARAIALTPGTKRQEQILAEVGTGLFVQSVTGLHSGVNPVSGDFSVGAEGLMIRDGAFAEPVREITIASTLQRMLKEIVAIGSDIEWLPGIAAGMTIAIADVSMSGA